MSVKCRVWWPKELLSSQQAKSSCNLLLFGWFISCSPSSLDVVVAFAYSDEFLSLHSSDSSIQEALDCANRGMPVTLQDKYSLTVVGCCVLPFENMDPHNLDMVNHDHNLHFSKYAEGSVLNGQHSSLKNPKKLSCGCLDLDGLLKRYKHASLCSLTWIRLVHDACSFSSIDIGWFPILDHLHSNGKLVPQAELHDSVILAINCSAATNLYFCKDMGFQISSRKSLLYMFFNFIWRFWAAVVATFSTFLYTVLQLFNKLAGRGSRFWMCIVLVKTFSYTWKNIQVRCHQILYWPILLGDPDLRSQACVEYAEKARLQRHSLWTAAVIDVFLGNLVGFALLFHAEAVHKWFSTFAIHFVDDVLRTGCVWLMGVPAGFKLNTELAGVLGIISLNAIQIWCTLWFSAADIFSYVIKIQALTALWRLFRGRKWNPLRQRLDSYEYSVEQHVVGSLMFTPLLLLLPTTSVFYIFFAIVNLTIIFSLTLIEIIIFIIHDTPYSQILIWLLRSKRFPSGIWFDTIHYQSASLVDGSFTVSMPPSKSMPQGNHMNSRQSLPLLSLLCSNIFTLGQVVFPHYKNIYDGFYLQTLRSAMSGILTGKSISTTRCSENSRKMPWMSIPYKDYWYICYNAVLAYMQ